MIFFVAFLSLKHLVITELNRDRWMHFSWWPLGGDHSLWQWH